MSTVLIVLLVHTFDTHEKALGFRATIHQLGSIELFELHMQPTGKQDNPVRCRRCKRVSEQVSADTVCRKVTETHVKSWEGCKLEPLVLNP